jgi:hypothetical protein
MHPYLIQNTLFLHNYYDATHETTDAVWKHQAISPSLYLNSRQFQELCRNLVWE